MLCFFFYLLFFLSSILIETVIKSELLRTDLKPHVNNLGEYDFRVSSAAAIRTTVSSGFCLTVSALHDCESAPSVASCHLQGLKIKQVWKCQKLQLIEWPVEAVSINLEHHIYSLLQNTFFSPYGYFPHPCLLNGG